MEFFTNAVESLKTLVTALGAGLGVWGIINLMEGYGGDNPGAKSQGIKQLMAGGGIILLAQKVIPELGKLFSVDGGFIFLAQKIVPELGKFFNA